jgi:hypothetical protein
MKYLVLALVLLGLVGCKPGIEELVTVNPRIVCECRPEIRHREPVCSCYEREYVIRYMSRGDYYSKYRKGRLGFWETWHPEKKVWIGNYIFKITDRNNPVKEHCEEALVLDSPTTIHIDFRYPREPCPE